MKKKVLSLLFCFTAMLSISSVKAANITSCQSVMEDAIIDEKIPNTVSTIVLIIKVAVPILLVIFGSLDLMKGVIAGKEDEIKKGQQIFIKRLIAGALVFFVFVIVQFLISLVAGSGDNENIMTCANCFINNKCTKVDTNSIKNITEEMADRIKTFKSLTN